MGSDDLGRAWADFQALMRQEGLDIDSPGDARWWMTMKQLQMQVEAQYPQLGLFALDKVMSSRYAQVALGRLLDEHGGANSCRDPITVFLRSGGHDSRDLPDFALTAILEEAIDPAVEREFIAFAWTSPEYPEANGTTSDWRAVFERHDWITDPHDDDDDGDGSEASDRPHGTLTLWRGSIPERSRGLAWTGDRERAHWFATRFGDALASSAQVWQVSVEAVKVRARFTGRGEDEYVVLLDDDDTVIPADGA